MNRHSTDRRYEETLQWLLESNPWSRYNTLVELCELSASDPERADARTNLLQNEAVQGLLRDAAHWFPYLPKRHTDPKLSHYTLRMLADFGLTCDDLGEDIISRVTEHRDGEAVCHQTGTPGTKQATRAEER